VENEIRAFALCVTVDAKFAQHVETKSSDAVYVLDSRHAAKIGLNTEADQHVN
jgi:hypothetical protein